MRWRKISEYAIESECGKWRISKACLDGCSMYCLHDSGGAAVKYAEDVGELKIEAENAKTQLL